MSKWLVPPVSKPWIDLELLSYHHHNWFRLWKQQTLHLRKIKAADGCQTGLYLLHALNRLGTVELSSPQFVSAWKTRIPSTKKATDECQTGLSCCRPLMILELLSCHHHGLFPLRKTRNPSSKQKAADECQTGLYLLQALSRLGTAELSPPRFVSA